MTGQAGQSAEQEYRRRIKAARSRVRRFAPLFGLVVLGVCYLVGLSLLWAGMFAVFVTAAVAPPRSAAVTNAKYWRAGAKGEQSTAKILARLEREGWRILHDLFIWDRANIDHIAIGPGGIFLIDSKVRHRPDFIDLPHTTRKELDVTARMAESVGAALGREVVAMWAVHGTYIQRGGFAVGGVHVASAKDLVYLLTHVSAYMRPEDLLSPKNVEEYAHLVLDEFGSRR